MRTHLKIHDILAALISGFLIIQCYPPVSFWGVSFFAITPWLIATVRQKKLLDVVLLGFLFQAAFVCSGFYWIVHTATSYGGLPTIVGLLVLFVFSLFAELQFVFFGVVVWASFTFFMKQQRRVIFLAILPMVFLALDWWNPKVFPSSFGNLLVGWRSVAQSAEWWSYHGLSFLVIFSNLFFCVLWTERKSLNRFSRLGYASVAVVFLLLLLGLHQIGSKRIQKVDSVFNGIQKKIKISGIQANIGDIDKLASERGFTPAINLILSTYREMSFESVDRFKPDLIIWPETAYPYLYTHLEDEGANASGTARDQWIIDLVDSLNTPLLFGTYTQRGSKDFNSAVLVEPKNLKRTTYLKSILLAFGEYVPLGPLSGWVQDLIPAIADFGRGPGAQILEVHGVKLAPQICYEGLVPEHSRQSVIKGAQVLLNITNDSWFGPTSEPWMHLGLTSLRAIEVRRPLLRITNTGISTLISPTGELQYKTRLFEPEALEVLVPVLSEGTLAKTFFEKHGEVLAQLASVITAIYFVFLGVFLKLKALKKSKA